jgi:hypothetical protein
MKIETKFEINQTVSCCTGLKLRKVKLRKSKISSILIVKADKPYVNNKKFKIIYGLHNLPYYEHEENLFLTVEEAEAEEKKREHIDN